MANLVWTSILYFSTLGIVYVVYRVFVADRRVESERKTREMISRSYGGAGLPTAQSKTAQAKAAPAAARFPLKPPPKSKPSAGNRFAPR
jgi:hypothetical protein